MTFAAVSVAESSLTVDAAQTIRTVLDSEDTARGQLLRDALTLATLEHPVCVVRRGTRAAAGDVTADVAGVSVGGVLDKLAAAGCVEVRQLWQESSADSYLDQARTVSAVHVLRAFTVLTVDACGRPNRTLTTPAGWYLLGEVGDDTRELVSVAAIDVDVDEAELLGDWLVEQEGFLASTCAAGCDSCGSQWKAETGEWTFSPELGDSTLVWAFDDAKDIDEQRNTIACPACAAGRVGFEVY